MRCGTFSIELCPDQLEWWSKAKPGSGRPRSCSRVAEEATTRGFRVLSTAGAVTEARYAYAAVADLLDSVDSNVLADLPAVQRTALERVLLLVGDGPATNERTGRNSVSLSAAAPELQHAGAGDDR